MEQATGERAQGRRVLVLESERALQTCQRWYSFQHAKENRQRVVFGLHPPQHAPQVQEAGRDDCGGELGGLYHGGACVERAVAAEVSALSPRPRSSIFSRDSIFCFRLAILMLSLIHI